MKTLVLLSALLFVLPLTASGTTATPMLATAYCLRGTTATGDRAGPGSIAVDPHVIPLGSRVWVQDYGWGKANDTGSAIRGRHVDVWIASCAAAIRWGAPTKLVSVH